MARTIRVQRISIVFPASCVVCGRPAEQTYPFERTFFYGKSSIPVTLPAPVCAEHAALANQKSPAEKFVVKTAPWLGLAVGVAMFAGLLVYWSGSGEDNLALNLLIAFFTGHRFSSPCGRRLCFG